MFITISRSRRLFYPLLVLSAVLLVLQGLTQAASANPLSITQAVLVQTIDTSQWSPPSPDPSGITYWSTRNTLLVADGEVDEMPALFTGDNIFETTLTGSLVDTYSTLAFSNEPTGIEFDISVDPVTGRFFISADTQGQHVYVLDPGPDRLPGTADDTITSFTTTTFGCNDPEGIAYGQNKLFIACGAEARIYVLSPGPNGNFDGVAPDGDDQATFFSTSSVGVTDPEGVEHDSATGTLYIAGTKGNMVEATTTGSLIRTIDLSAINPVKLADVTIAPGSQNSSERHFYLVDRGVDNNTDPNENDGKIYEVTLDTAPPPPNMLANPGFETDANNDGKPDAWSTNANFTRSSEVVHGGSYAGKHFATNNSGYVISQTVNGISAGADYTALCWVNIPSTSDSFKLNLQVKWRNASNKSISTTTFKKYTKATNGWVQAISTLTAPTGAAKAEFRMNVSSLNATLYVDDCVFGQ